MMKRLIAIAALALLAPCVSHGRDFSYADAVPFLGLEGATDILKKSVCAIQIPGDQSNKNKKDDWVSIGSGFIVLGERNAVLAVTCEHVVKAALKNKKPPFIGLDTEKGYRRFLCNIAHLDASNDIAVLAPQRGTDEDVKLQSIVFPDSIFDDGSSLVEGRGVVIPGYPLALGVADDKNHPVIRIGIVAQYTGKKHFLVDGIASHGNSGSPVFALKYKERKLVGMVTSHVADTINLLDEKGQLSARLPYNSGLARAITMSPIVDAIKKAKY